MGNVASDAGARSPEGGASSPESGRRSARDWSPPAYATRSGGSRELSSVAEGVATTAPLATGSVDAEGVVAEPTSRRSSSNGLVIVREGTNLDVSFLHRLF